MIAEWMAYAFVIAGLVTLAAMMIERIATLRGLQRRWIWISSLVLSLLLPALFASQSMSSNRDPRAALAALASPDAPPRYAQPPIAWIGGGTMQTTGGVAIDTWLLAGWAVSSGLVLATFVLGWLHLKRRLRASSQSEIDSVSVTITEDIGPAVVGVIHPRIVVPRWLLTEDASTQSVVLAHEREHLRAHDVRVLGGALLIAALLPWNVPIWWQLRKLRFALEVDCDNRVLRAGQSRTSYGTVLLHVATRLMPLRVAAAGLSESASSLEKRISLMHAPIRAQWRLMAVCLGTCSVAFIAAAANVTAPRTSPLAVATDTGLPLLPTPVAAQSADEAALADAITHFYPQLLQPQAGRPYVWALVNEHGAVSQIDLTVQPSWVSQEVFDSDWRKYLESTGVAESEIRQQLVMQIRVGPNHIVVAWLMLPGAVARDASAPKFDLAPNQARTMEARMLATVDAQRRVIEHFDPAALRDGVPAGQELWFLIDADGHTLNAGRRAIITDPQAARHAMQKLFPDVSVSYVTRGTIVKDGNGKRVPVSWQWLEREESESK